MSTNKLQKRKRFSQSGPMKNSEIVSLIRQKRNLTKFCHFIRCHLKDIMEKFRRNTKSFFTQTKEEHQNVHVFLVMKYLPFWKMKISSWRLKMLHQKWQKPIMTKQKGLKESESPFWRNQAKNTMTSLLAHFILTKMKKIWFQKQLKNSRNKTLRFILFKIFLKKKEKKTLSWLCKRQRFSSFLQMTKRDIMQEKSKTCMTDIFILLRKKRKQEAV